MAENFPLLFFPFSTPDVKIVRRRFVQSHISSPGVARQRDRIGPVFRELCDALEARRIHIQGGADGIDPKAVLVLETVGSVDNFANAVRRIEGLDWLGEFDVDDIVQDEDFYDEENPERLLSGRLYMVSSNSRALQELQSLWRRYVDNPQMHFDHGYSRFREVFSLLRTIRRWDVSDRFIDTGVMSYWQEQLDVFGEERIRFEIELWYKSNPEERSRAIQSVSQMLEQLQGQVITHCEIDAIRYSAVLAELPAGAIRSLMQNQEISLLKSEDIMFFRPSGQMVSTISTFETLPIPEERKPALQVNGSPVIGLFDGYPLANHSLLSNRLIVDDPDNYQEDYESKYMRHGTAMCSLIAKGDLTQDNDFITSPIYVRPIMKPNPHAPNNEEHVPSDHLLVDVIHRAVKRMFEPEDGRPPVAPTVKIINFSIGDPARMYFHSVSPLAKMLDWLSNKYSVLFIISAGNVITDFNLPCTENEFNGSAPDYQAKLFATEILNSRRYRRILSPGESINNLTIGAVHNDTATIRPFEPRVNPYQMLMPATYTSFGAGHRGSVKPDFVYDGGRQTFTKDVLHFSPLKPCQFPKATPGQLVAAPGETRTESVYCIGTSNSTALVTRAGFFCNQTIEELSHVYPMTQRQKTLLIKAMLAHGTSWGDLGGNIDIILNPALDTIQRKKIKTKWIGYGYPDWDKSLSCNTQRVTVVGLHSLKKEKADLYHFPIPECLNATTIKRKLTVTLTWFSSINVSSQKYRNARLWVEVQQEGFLIGKEDVADINNVKKGTLQHEVFYGERAVPVAADDTITIKVTCDKDASNITEEIDYALMVTLEVAPGVQLPIYQQVSERIAQQIPVRVDGIV